MEEDIRLDILNILREGRKALREADIKTLKELSNHTIHDASIFQDKNSINIAVLIYSLSKIYERGTYKKYKSWQLFDNCVNLELGRAEISLQKEDINGFEDAINQILGCIDKLDAKFKSKVIEIVENTKVNKASRLYEHGLSIGKTAELLGVSEWELMDYSGKTGISDVELALSKDVVQRIKFTRELFK